MPWVRLDDQFPEHPKVSEAGPLAAWLYVCGLAYCARQLTDGFIPAAQLRRLLPTGSVAKLADRLVSARLWEPTDGGFRVHDYLEYQPSRVEVEAERSHLRAVRAAAGRLGGVRSGAVRRRADEANNEANPKQTPSKNEANAKPRTHPVPIPVMNREEKVVEGGSGGERAAGAAGSTGPVVDPGEPLDAPRASELEARPPAPNWVDSFRRVAR